MDVIVAGPGRAGVALALMVAASEHRVAGVTARDREAADAAGERVGALSLPWHDSLPEADLLVIAVRDDAIGEVAAQLAPLAGGVEAVVHLSGSTSVDALEPFEGQRTGSFHPLQTIPDAEAGAMRLEGAWAAITTADDLLADRLFALAASIGMRPFELDDSAKPLYHAAAAAAANYPLAALMLSEQLFDAAGVPFEAAHPLIQAVIANAVEMGPEAALTGPIARGDVGTVRDQLAAVADVSPELLEAFVAMGRATSRVSDAGDEMKDLFR